MQIFLFSQAILGALLPGPFIDDDFFEQEPSHDTDGANSHESE